MPQLNSLFNGDTLLYETRFEQSKMTDSNHLMNLYQVEPGKFDPEFINVFSQRYLSGDSFLIDIETAPDYYVNATDTYKYKIPKYSELPRITENLSSLLVKPGVSRTPFKTKLDRNDFVINDTITCNFRYAPQMKVVAEPRKVAGGWEYELMLLGMTDAAFVDQKFLRVGLEYFKVGSIQGEFDTKYSSFVPDGNIELQAYLGAEFGVEHKFTDWAYIKSLNLTIPEDKQIVTIAQRVRDSYGNPVKDGRGQEMAKGIGWIPKAELLMMIEHKKMKSRRAMWDNESISPSSETGEMIYNSPGLYKQMKNYGNYFSFNKGDLTMKHFRDYFGQLFYNRVSMENRKVELRVNEAAYQIFSNLIGQEVRAGLPMLSIKDDRVINGNGLDMGYSAGFSSIKTLDMGMVTMKHYQILDEPQGNISLLGGRKTEPVFMVFDVSNDSEPNMRQIKQKGHSTMTWHYIKGITTTQSPYSKVQGFSQYMASSRNKYDEMLTRERNSVKLLDPSRCVLMEQNPSF